jgi:hypothetical protein
LISEKALECKERLQDGDECHQLSFSITMSDANTYPSKVLSLEELEIIWTTDRSDRASANDMKVRRIDGGSKSLRGGDFVTPSKQMSDDETYDIKHFTAKIVQKQDDEIYDIRPGQQRTGGDAEVGQGHPKTNL